jgi:drug/metabolite transporter superfamily protein YnfA
MLWTERLFQLIPIGKEHGSFASFFAARMIRSLCLTFILFLVGVLAVFISANKTMAQDPRGLTSYGYFFASMFLASIVSGWFKRKWDWFFGARA